MKDIFSPELLSFTFQINLIKKWISKVIQTVYYFVNKEKYCQICFCLVWFYFTLLVCAHFCGEIERCQLGKTFRYFNILRPMKNDIRFECFPWKNVWFWFISNDWIHFSHKTEKFRFWKSLKYFNISDFSNISQIWICPANSLWFGLSLVVWVQFWQETSRETRILKFTEIV